MIGGRQLKTACDLASVNFPVNLMAYLLATPNRYIATCTTRSFPARFASYIA